MLLLTELQVCVTTNTADARRHYVSGLVRAPAGGLFTFCGKHVFGVVLERIEPEDVCPTCLSAAKYWGFR